MCIHILPLSTKHMFGFKIYIVVSKIEYHIHYFIAIFFYIFFTFLFFYCNWLFYFFVVLDLILIWYHFFDIPKKILSLFLSNKSSIIPESNNTEQTFCFSKIQTFVLYWQKQNICSTSVKWENTVTKHTFGGTKN